MKHKPLGTTGLDLPVVGLGTWSIFDGDEDRTSLVAAALRAGVTLFDSSPMYGVAETRLAEALGPRRTEAIVATKVSAVDGATGAAQIAHARGLFGTVDLYQIHNIVAWRTHLPVLQRMKAEGCCRAIGISQGLLVSDEAFEEVMRTGAIDSIQIRYNPLRRDAERRLLPLARELGLAVLVMQPLRWGVLRARPTAAELDRLDVADWGQAILRWILSESGVSSVLTTSQRVDRIASNAAVAALPPLTATQRAMVEAIIARAPPAPAVTLSTLPCPALAAEILAFLERRRGASYCAPCLAEALGASTVQADEARRTLPDAAIAQEHAACLSCGGYEETSRARTIMR